MRRRRRNDGSVYYSKADGAWIAQISTVGPVEFLETSLGARLGRGAQLVPLTLPVDRAGRAAEMTRAHPPLSRRQAEVLLARCQTGSRKEAAERLGVTVSGVRFHLDRAYARCGCLDDAAACYQHAAELNAAELKAATITM